MAIRFTLLLCFAPLAMLYAAGCHDDFEKPARSALAADWDAHQKETLRALRVLAMQSQAREARDILARIDQNDDLLREIAKSKCFLDWLATSFDADKQQAPSGGPSPDTVLDMACDQTQGIFKKLAHVAHGSRRLVAAATNENQYFGLADLIELVLDNNGDSAVPDAGYLRACFKKDKSPLFTNAKAAAFPGP